MFYRFKKEDPAKSEVFANVPNHHVSIFLMMLKQVVNSAIKNENQTRLLAKLGEEHIKRGVTEEHHISFSDTFIRLIESEFEDLTK